MEFSKITDFTLFKERYFELNYKILEEEVDLFLLKRRKIEDEEDFFDFNEFINKRNIRRSELSMYTEKISETLKRKGWRITFGFAGTGIWIYRETPPKAAEPWN